MKSKTVIKVDLAHSSYVPMVEAIQGDGGTRCVSIQLLDDGKPWMPPEKSDIAVVYTQPGGKKGFYNKLPDGRTAISVCGNTVTATLAPNMLSVAGEIHAALVFNNNQLDQLSTFPFVIMVAKNQFAGAQEAEDYIRLQWLEDKLEERILQLISTEECARAGVAAQEATIAAAAAQEQAASAENAASSANDAAARADDAAAGANAAAAAAQTVVDGIAPEVEQLNQSLAAVTPDDTAVGEKPWTSRKIVESLCQTFAETGNPIQCHPVAGYPLGVKIQIVPIQEGEGDPSPENVREITGTVAVKIVHSNDAGDSNTHDITIPETVYGGTLDLGTGNAEITWAIKTLEVTKFSYNTTINCLLRFNNPLPGIEKPANNTMVAGIKCNKAVSRSASAINGGKSGIGVDINGNIYFRSDGLTSLDDYISAFGDNITVAYKIAEPHTIQLDPQQITALSGVNTFYTDADGVIVIGLEDPRHTITELKNAIISLGGNI